MINNYKNYESNRFCLIQNILFEFYWFQQFFLRLESIMRSEKPLNVKTNLWTVLTIQYIHFNCFMVFHNFTILKKEKCLLTFLFQKGSTVFVIAFSLFLEPSGTPSLNCFILSPWFGRSLQYKTCKDCIVLQMLSWYGSDKNCYFLKLFYDPVCGFYMVF